MPSRSLHLLFLVLLFGILVNLTMVDIHLIVTNRAHDRAATLYSIPSPTPFPDAPTTQACPVSCLTAVTEATRSTELAILEKIPTQQPTIMLQTKEHFIPFGTGSTDSGDWIDIPGLQVSIDSNNYPNKKRVVFEASIRIPTGNEIAYVRLFNVTDKHPVWYSELATPAGGGNQLLMSQPMTLDAGTKTYQVQMKTSLKYPAILDQSRLHITMN